MMKINLEMKKTKKYCHEQKLINVISLWFQLLINMINEFYHSKWKDFKYNLKQKTCSLPQFRVDINYRN